MRAVSVHSAAPGTVPNSDSASRKCFYLQLFGEIWWLSSQYATFAFGQELSRSGSSVPPWNRRIFPTPFFAKRHSQPDDFVDSGTPVPEARAARAQIITHHKVDQFA